MPQHVRQLSDIRAKDAPAFRLNATFSFVGDHLDTFEGTYTQTWVSDSQWSRETVIGNVRQIDVGGSGQHWLVYPDGFSVLANALPWPDGVRPACFPGTRIHFHQGTRER
jgi:hypothetical protein